MAEEKQARRFYVSGRVQGVGYRFFAQRIADKLGLSGYTKNLADGRVEVLALGRPAELETLRAQLRRGPHLAQVEDVEEIDASLEEARDWTQGFSIE